MIEVVSTWPRSTWWRPGVRVAALVAPLATCAVLSTLRNEVTAATSVLVLVVWVVAAAATGDRIAGILAAVSSVVWFDFFLTEPYLTFTIDDDDDVEAAVLLLLIGLVVSEIALWGYRQQAQASRRSGYLDGVLGAARAVAEGGTSATTLTIVVARQIGEVLGAQQSQYVDGPLHDARIAVLDHEGELTRDGRRVDVDRVGLPFDEYVAVPVRRGVRVIGHFLVSASTHPTYPTKEQRRVAVLLADQVAGALEGPAS